MLNHLKNNLDNGTIFDSIAINQESFDKLKYKYKEKDNDMGSVFGLTITASEFIPEGSMLFMNSYGEVVGVINNIQFEKDNIFKIIKKYLRNIKFKIERFNHYIKTSYLN